AARHGPRLDWAAWPVDGRSFRGRPAFSRTASAAWSRVSPSLTIRPATSRCASAPSSFETSYPAAGESRPASTSPCTSGASPSSDSALTTVLLATFSSSATRRADHPLASISARNARACSTGRRSSRRQLSTSCSCNSSDALSSRSTKWQLTLGRPAAKAAPYRRSPLMMTHLLSCGGPPDAGRVELAVCGQAPSETCDRVMVELLPGLMGVRNDIPDIHDADVAGPGTAVTGTGGRVRLLAALGRDWCPMGFNGTEAL